MANQLEKKKVVRVGNKAFTFVPAGYNNGIFDCELVCPYAKYCESLPDPRDPENPEKKFIDFCGSIGLEDGNSGNLAPKNGTIEENYKGNEDIMKLLVDKNPMVDIKEFIDSVCSGFCESYQEDYCNCTSDNAGCLLCGLLKNKSIKKDDEGKLSFVEFNTTDEGTLKAIDENKSN